MKQMNSLILIKDLFCEREALSERTVHLWAFSVDQAVPSSDFKDILSTQEHTRAESFVVEEARKRFIFSRGMLRWLLGHYLGMCPRDIAIVNSAYGKPQLLKTEGDLQFNLSHSQELVFFAFIRGRRIGIDIEKIREIPNVAQIVRRFFSLKDREDFFKLSSEDQKVDFFNKWTRMEASLKAIGQGLHFSLDEKPFSQKKFEEETLEAGEEWSFYNLNPGPDYRGALVVEGRKHRLVTQWFRFETQSIPLI